LHAALLRHQDTTAVRDEFGNLFEAKLLKGKYKDHPNNPKKSGGIIHQYCPPEQVESEMERLLSLHAEHEKKGVPVEIEAAWLHHRFTQIHPYPDGNGRVARALASLLFIKAGWFPVVVTRDDRAEYIDSLEAADEVGLSSQVAFFVQLQRREIGKAMRTGTRPIQTVAEAIAAARNDLLHTKSDPAFWANTKEVAGKLLSFAESRLEEMKKTLESEMGQAQARVTLSFSGLFPELLLLPYAPETSVYHQARGLSLEVPNGTSFPALSHLEIHAQAMGSKFRGLIGFVAVFMRSGNIRKISKELFQINYAESTESAEHRFRPWLEDSLVNALTMWRKSL
jgi:fido (protein-threonine AMPylation protein)